ncbi:YdiU family protein [Roseibium denhamense]|uniref:Protein nucleotidyltransferase YdiU n=1 Tax=Roseibium denhamense TaxID=76305 RepID=A0ABY1PG88_9HYPH|nr:YdiU family protein [Roseibium denhamense]MTI04751.1 YdiU family protein [Roseibium denhamense]SMP33461.1 Uncharacterized conserved protein YdiU, UPF0061 family [Roseibium denhamense]
MTKPLFQFDNTYARELPGFYVDWKGAEVPQPELALFNQDLAASLGLNGAELETEAGARIFAGVDSPEGAAPLAQVYAGHQFGGFSPQLGDGRALLIGEIVDPEGQRRDIQLKGSGRTPFSRGGDGKAVLGPVLREYVIGEAMHALGIPTTRALAAVTTGERVYREGPKPGAVLARVAASHLRIGTFQYFAARQETDKVRQLADYAIHRHDPDLVSADGKYLKFFSRVIERQAALVANWVLVGFVHGVMNTDNTTISGETIDYGPCAFLDAYDPAAVFSSIDHGGRYAFGRQPVILQWNLARLAEAILALINPDDLDKAVEQVTEELNRFPDLYRAQWLNGMRQKLGLKSEDAADQKLAEDLLALMADSGADYTLVFRTLADAATGNSQGLKAQISDLAAIEEWLARWTDRLSLEEAGPDVIATQMNAVNPLYIPRNHLVEYALEQAEAGDLAPVRKLLEAVTAPYEARDGFEDFTQPAPENFGPYTTYCGT